MIVLRIILAIIGLLGIADTALLLSVSNGNLGTVLPFLIGAPLLILSVFYRSVTAWFASSVIGRTVKWMIISAYVVFGVFIAVISAVIYDAGTRPPEDGADALIVLGAGVREDRISLTLKYRLDSAVEYLDRNKDTIVVVSGGQGRGESVTEASAMSKYLLTCGIDTERIVLENAAESTEENFAFSKPVIEERCGSDAKIVFITTDFHVFRAQRTAQRAGVAATGFGAPGVWYTSPNDYMRECIALTVYYLTGKI